MQTLALFDIAVGGLVFLLIAVLSTVFWIWMLVDAITNKRLSDGERVAWVLAIIFLPFLGSLLYLVIAYSRGR